MTWLNNELLREYFVSVPNLSIIHKIEKGFSGEEKFLLKETKGIKYLLRAHDIAYSNSMRNHYDILTKIESLGILMTKPIEFIEMENEKKVCILLTYIEGEDAEDTLLQLNEKEQYEAGKKAGDTLRRLHTLKPDLLDEDWEGYKSKKHQKYVDKFNEIPGYKENYAFVLDYINNNIHRMKNRNSVFLHDDFHPSNLIINEGEFAGVIDFNRYEWGDPYHDFHKIALFTRNISIPFSVGQIHGYFDGEPNQDFWHLYTLYAAMVVISAIVWTINFTPKLMDEMIVRVDQILSDHKQLNTEIPQWYYQIEKK